MSNNNEHNDNVTDPLIPQKPQKLQNEHLYQTPSAPQTPPLYQYAPVPQCITTTNTVNQTNETNDADSTRIYPSIYQSYEASNLDMYGKEIVVDEGKLCYALLWTIFGFIFWPSWVVSFIVISPLKKKMSRYSRQYCKVTSIYFISLYGMIIGSIATIAGFIELVVYNVNS
jgi:hypothetical protein